MSKSYKVTVRFPKSLQQEMIQAIIKEGYGLKGKSKWGGEAIERFLELPDYHEFVDLGTELSNTDLVALESFYFDSVLVEKIEKAIVLIRKVYPILEGVKSILIRTSIIQRLLRPNNLSSDLTKQ